MEDMTSFCLGHLQLMLPSIETFQGPRNLFHGNVFRNILHVFSFRSAAMIRIFRLLPLFRPAHETREDPWERGRIYRPSEGCPLERRDTMPATLHLDARDFADSHTCTVRHLGTKPWLLHALFNSRRRHDARTVIERGEFPGIRGKLQASRA
jgi:hypothetical protein